MLINFRITLISERLFQLFDRHSDKRVVLSELLLNINKFHNKTVDFLRKLHERGF